MSCKTYKTRGHARTHMRTNLVQESTLLKNPSKSTVVLDPLQIRSMIKRFRNSNISAYPPTSPLKNPLPYGGSFFQSHIIAYLTADSDSSSKSIYTKCLSFFNIPSGKGSKITKNAFSPTFLNLPPNLSVFCIFYLVPIKKLKKERHFVYTLFYEESESAIGIVKK